MGKRLVFVQGNWSVQASPLPVSLYDEFGFASTGASYTAAQMLALLLPMVRPDVRIETVRYVDFGTPVNATEREYVLDMRGLKALIGKHSEFAHIGDELVPVQLSDTNWKKGIWINTAIRQDAGFFVYNSARNKQRLAEAATLVFDKSGPRKILSQDETAPYINIWVEGPPLDPEWDGYPHAIAIQK